ncbi:MAG: type II secretion system minor pseudopilin GspI [Gallionella sp.]|nr:type II secretion system minor pseudopilin GspI [Gallionella sp.]
MSACKSRGFTLLEVLIALAILAIALTAAGRIASISVDTAMQVRQRIVAHWVAENRIVALRAAPLFAPIGSSSGEVEQAGFILGWEEVISGTPNPNFRRVEIRVFAIGSPNYAYADLVAYLPAQK